MTGFSCQCDNNGKSRKEKNMDSTSEVVMRLVRGIVGLVIVISGILNQNWIGILGVFLLMSAITGKCGFGGNSCSVKKDE